MIYQIMTSQHKSILVLLLFLAVSISLTNSFLIKGIQPATWNIGDEDGTFLNITGKRYSIQNQACYRRLFYDGATTMIKK